MNHQCMLLRQSKSVHFTAILDLIIQVRLLSPKLFQTYVPIICQQNDYFKSSFSFHDIQFHLEAHHIMTVLMQMSENRHDTWGR